MPILNTVSSITSIHPHKKPRYSPGEKNMGWHVHCDKHKKVGSFLRKPGELLLFNESFYQEYLLERLTGEIIRV